MDNKDLKNKKILVLMGGWNEEREVSLASGQGVLETLLKAGYNATSLDFDHDFVSKVTKIAPDIVFIALHGKFGEDGRVQSILDFLKIPYTHSPSVPCSICMNKVLSSRVVESLGLNAPNYAILHKTSSDNNNKISRIGYPIVIKPIDSGSSVGVEIVNNASEFDIDKYKWPYGDKVIAQEYISGKEIQVAVLDNKAIGAIEVRPKSGFYNYESKYTSGMTDYIMPAEISTEHYDESLKISEIIHGNFDCSGVSRVDYILNEKNNKLYFLEINTHPGFTENSLVPKIAKYQGISFLQVTEYLLNTAKCAL